MNTKDEITFLTMEYLHRFCIDVSSMGYDYLKRAIELCCEDESLINKVTTELYFIIAREFDVTNLNVERAIRNVLDKAYKEGGMLELNEFFNAIVYKNEEKFSNSEFIAIMVKLIKFQLMKDEIYEKYKIKIS